MQSMKQKHKRRALFEENSYWQSYSDMMAALLLIFILMIAITLAIYKQKTVALDQTSQELELAYNDLESYKQEIAASNEELANSLALLQEAYANAALTKEELDAAYLEIENAKAELAAANLEIENARLELGAANVEIENTQAELAATKSELQDIVGIRTDIIGELQKKFDESSMSVDSQTGSITFSADVLFALNSSTLTKDSKEVLREVIPLYLDVLLQDSYREYIAEIIIEGHTDTNGSYAMNMQLSSDRAASVANFCLNSSNGLDEEEIERLKELLTINGRSFSDPIYESNGTDVDMAASRRVEIKFRLKEDEMIEKIAAILAQE